MLNCIMITESIQKTHFFKVNKNNSKITTDKASEGDGIPTKIFKILKIDGLSRTDAVAKTPILWLPDAKN